MTDLPTLGIVLYTYGSSPERAAYAKRTLESVDLHLQYGGSHSRQGADYGPRRLHLADDGSPAGYLDELYAFATADLMWPAADVTMSNAERGGYGASYNLATMVTHAECPILLALEDDWELRAPLDITPFVRILGGSPTFPDYEIRSIRLGYIGYTSELRGTLVSAEGEHFLLLDPNSPEPHVFSGHPRLETRDYQRHVGLWPEGLPAGATEFQIATTVEAAREGVAWPMRYDPRCGPFAHIGTVLARED